MNAGTESKASFRKLKSGAWGIRVVGAPPESGQTVSVHTKAGEVQSVTVGGVIWTGNGVALCAIVSAKPQGGGGPMQRYYRQWRSGSYGGRAPHGRVCPECGSRDCAKAWNGRDLCDED